MSGALQAHYPGDLQHQLRTQDQLRGLTHGFAARGRPKAKNPQGARKGYLGLRVLLRFHVTLAGHTLRFHALFSELALRSELILSNPAIWSIGVDLGSV